MTQEAWLEMLEQEGFVDLVVRPNGPGMDFPEHTHYQLTVHVILDGELAVADKNGDHTYRQGDRFDIPAGTVHAARCGPAGCTFIVGVKPV